MAKQRLIERAQRCSMYTSMFYGYVQGRRYIEVNTSINQMAIDFVKDYDIDDIVDDKVLQVNYMNFMNLYREIKRAE